VAASTSIEDRLASLPATTFLLLGRSRPSTVTVAAALQVLLTAGFLIIPTLGSLYENGVGGFFYAAGYEN
jgi:hypothetical protein